MREFQIGDEVELAVDAKEFKRNAISIGSMPEYVSHFISGHSAIVSGFHHRGKEHMSFRVDGKPDSNFFLAKHFRLVDSELSKIKQESQRL